MSDTLKLLSLCERLVKCFGPGNEGSNYMYSKTTYMVVFFFQRLQRCRRW